jgi:hypothetical protein
MRLAILVLLLTVPPCGATTFARPTRHDVFSHNRAFVLDVNPATEVHTVYDVRDRSKPLWSFSEPAGIAPILLSDDGRVVATVDWMYVKAEDIADTTAVVFWNRDGQFRAYPLKELCPDPPKTQDVGVGPIGDFWRTWYTDVTDDGESLTISTTRGMAYRFRFVDGILLERRPFGWRAWGPWVIGGALAGSLVGATLWWLRQKHLSKRLAHQ